MVRLRVLLTIWRGQRKVSRARLALDGDVKSAFLRVKRFNPFRVLEIQGFQRSDN